MQQRTRESQRCIFDTIIPEVTRMVRDGSRSEVMTDQLLEALKLFKNNRLARALPISTTLPEVFGEKLLQRQRDVFARQYRALGELAITAQFYAPLSTRTQNVCQNLHNFETASAVRPTGTFIPLRDLVQMTHADIIKYRNSGKMVAGEIELALNNLGLHLGMTAKEVEQCFGPKKS